MNHEPSIHAQSQPGRAAAIILVFTWDQEQLGENSEFIRRTPLGAVLLTACPDRPLPKTARGGQVFAGAGFFFGRMLGYICWHGLRIQEAFC